MSNTLIERAEQREYQKLFLHELNWSRPDHEPVVIEYEGRHITVTNVSQYKGIRVWVANEKPDSQLEAELDRQLAKSSTDRILILHDDQEQVWRWPVRRAVGNSTTTRLSRHKHTTGDTDPRFAEKLDVIRLPFNAALDTNAVLAKVRQAFDVEAQNETRYASKLMARLYTAMEKAYPPGADDKARDHEISVTLARILFLMFGDDTDMWRENLFQDFILNHTESDGSDIGAKLTQLFAHLDTKPDARPETPAALEGFRYVNGGIFKERLTLPHINAEFRDAVLAACDRDWKTISPAIFGSMFQSVRDTKTRRELGEHYTSEENILKTLNPLFLDELHMTLAGIASGTSEKGLREERSQLEDLHERLGRIRFMDPACGCGNFIIVAFRELRHLELAILERVRDNAIALAEFQESTLGKRRRKSTQPGVYDTALLANYGLKVTLDHFYGIEIDEWPARIAESAMFLIDRQCDLKLTERLGWAPDRLPIQEQATILSDQSALSVDWAEVMPPDDDTIIAGNPPFLGISLRSASQTAELQEAWGTRYHGTLDYVTGWHAKALDYFRGHSGRWAFVTTNSITQGEVVAPLFGAILSEGWRIGFAHRTFRWTSEAAGGAAVHCVIIGFTKDTGEARLFDYANPNAAPAELLGVENITPYLTDGPTVIVHPSSKPLNPQLGEVAYGNKPTDGGWLIVEPGDYAQVMADPIAAKYVRKYVGARELLHNGDRHCLWLTDMTATDLQKSVVLSERVEGVRAFRAESKAPSTRDAAATPQLFRQLAQPSAPYLCIPAHVSESRPYFLAARFGRDVITSNANFLAPDADGFMFAIISSTMFITWQRTVGGRLKSDLRFNKLLTWNTFPLPHTDSTARQSVIKAGAEVLRCRALLPGLSLADLYVPGNMPSDLVAAHDRLDSVIDDLFGLKSKELSVLSRQDRLFSRYLELTSPLLGGR